MMGDYIDRRAALQRVNEFFHDPRVDIGHLTNRVDLIDLPNYEQKFTNVEGVIG